MRRINRNTYLLNRKRSPKRRGLFLALFNRCSLTMFLVGLFLGCLVLPVMVSNLLEDDLISSREKEHTEWKQQEQKGTHTPVEVISNNYHIRRRPMNNDTDRIKSEEKGSHSIPRGQSKDFNQSNKQNDNKDDDTDNDDKDDNTDNDDNDDNNNIHHKYSLKSSRNDNSIPKEHEDDIFVLKDNKTEDMQKEILSNQHIKLSQSLPTLTTPYVMHSSKLPDSQRMKILVTGGAGFVGSHLVDKLMMLGHEVIVVDNFFTGQKKNIEHWMSHPNFSLIVHDITESITIEVDQIYHLACPASPPHYQYNPVKTIKTSTMGTLNMLGLAKRVKARMLLTSTSEVYGDPKVHPQPETYWGNVNTIGPRSCYDEGKRVAETMMMSYKNQNNVDIRIARIFNTFGPRMHPNDGRVVSNFIIQALQDKPLTVYGSGEQTRSFQYVDDLVDGLYALMNGNYSMPVNLGNPDEFTVVKFAEHIKEITRSKSEILHLEKSQDDPTQRKPSIDVAKKVLGWEPKVSVEDGLKKAIEYFQRVLDESGEIIPTGPGAAKPKVGVEV